MINLKYKNYFFLFSIIENIIANKRDIPNNIMLNVIFNVALVLLILCDMKLNPKSIIELADIKVNMFDNFMF